MTLPTDQQEIITITFLVWIVLLIIALVRLRKIPIESKQNEFPKLMVLALSVAGSFTLGITVLASVYFPQFLQTTSTASLVVTGFIGASISFWWTSATFWGALKSASNSQTTHQIQRTITSIERRSSLTGIPDDLNEPEKAILVVLNMGGTQNLSEIVNTLKFPKVTTTARLNELVAKGYVIISQRLSGRYYSLTTNGKRVAELLTQ